VWKSWRRRKKVEWLARILEGIRVIIVLALSESSRGRAVIGVVDDKGGE